MEMRTKTPSLLILVIMLADITRCWTNPLQVEMTKLDFINYNRDIRADKNSSTGERTFNRGVRNTNQNTENEDEENEDEENEEVDDENPIFSGENLVSKENSALNVTRGRKKSNTTVLSPILQNGTTTSVVFSGITKSDKNIDKALSDSNVTINDSTDAPAALPEINETTHSAIARIAKTEISNSTSPSDSSTESITESTFAFGNQNGTKSTLPEYEYVEYGYEETPTDEEDDLENDYEDDTEFPESNNSTESITADFVPQTAIIQESDTSTPAIADDDEYSESTTHDDVTQEPPIKSSKSNVFIILNRSSKIAAHLNLLIGGFLLSSSLFTLCEGISLREL